MATPKKTHAERSAIAKAAASKAMETKRKKKAAEKVYSTTAPEFTETELNDIKYEIKLARKKQPDERQQNIAIKRIWAEARRKKANQ
jgi:hypothetical protein